VRAGDGEKRINGGNLRVARRALAMHACGPWRRERDAEVVDGARKAVVEANARLPAEHALGERDVGPALARIVARGRHEDDLEREPTRRRTRSASSSTVNSAGLPMFRVPGRDPALPSV
jgi:hypothetical protein